MDILINGEFLDIPPGQEITLQYQNFRFANAIADQFSTDIELPRSERNQRILSAFIILDNNNQVFGDKIKCSCTARDIPEDGYLQITKLTKTIITVTLFLSLFPYNISSKKMCELMNGSDDTTTIKEWDKRAATTARTGHTTGYDYTYYRYSLTQFLNNQYAHQHLSVGIDTFQAAISTKLNIGLALTDFSILDTRLIAPNNFVCPENTKQTMQMIYDDESQNLIMIGGQHIVNDLPGFDIDDGRVEVVTFNRSCHAEIEYWGINICNQVEIKKYTGGSWQTLVISPLFSSYAHGTFSVNFAAGDIIKVDLTLGGTVTVDGTSAAVLAFEYSNYTIEDDDYQNTELIYPSLGLLPYLVAYGGGTSTYEFDGSTSYGTNTLPRLSFAYFGYWVNSGDFTLRDFITFICWATGLNIEVNGLDISLSKDGPKKKEIDGEIISIHPSADELGQKTYLKYDEQEYPQTLYFSSKFLTDEKTLYAAPFYYIKNIIDKYAQDVALYPQYTGESTEDEENNTTEWKFSFESLSAAFVVATVKTDRVGNPFYYATSFGNMQWHGLDGMSARSIKVEVSTFEDLRGYDYFYLEGRKYIIDEVEYNTNTGETTVTGLEVYEQF